MVSDEPVMRITVTVYRNGLCKIECDGGDVDCKIATYAVQQALKLADYVATVLLITLLSETTRKSSKDGNGSTGIL
jgi:hypothetical protein